MSTAKLACIVVVLGTGCQWIVDFKQFDGNDGSTGDTTSGTCSPDSGATTKGPEMVKVEMGPTACLWIDKTEVTRGQYQAFLDLHLPALAQTLSCMWNLDFSPTDCDADGGIVLNQDPDSPVVCVDFCDASAFCAWAEKRLCKGQWGGSFTNDPSSSEWYAACSSGGANVYPYGKNYQPGFCNDAGRADTGCTSGSCSTVGVGTLTGCRAQSSGAMDLSGNVEEWVDECDSIQGRVDNCHIRGGAVNTSSANCSNVSDKKRDFVHPFVGFRCCR